MKALLLLLWVIAASLSPAPCTAQVCVAGNCADTVTLGEILAAEYIRADNRLFIYAALPEPGMETILHVDDVNLLARAQLCCGEYGFSLDPSRSDGTTPFRVDDVIDPVRLAEQVIEGEQPVANLLRQQLSPDVLRILRSGGRLDGRRVEALVDALNTLRTGPDLAELATLSLMSRLEASDTAVDQSAVLERNRRLLEDTYRDSIRRQYGDRYKIRYYPEAHEAELEATLGETRLEATFNAVDTVLKRLVDEIDTAAEVGVGATDPFLCGAELQQLAMAGSLTTSRAGESNRYFDLQPTLTFDRFTGSAVRFGNQQIQVLSGEVTPNCMREAAGNITKNMHKLMSHPTFGSDFRRLRACLILTRVIAWTTKLLVPIDVARLEQHSTTRIVNEPPKLVLIPTSVAGLRNGLNSVVTGGLLVGASNATEFRRFEYQSSAISNRAARPPGFVTEQTQLDGASVLRVDISGILGLR